MQGNVSNVPHTKNIIQGAYNGNPSAMHGRGTYQRMENRNAVAMAKRFGVASETATTYEELVQNAEREEELKDKRNTMTVEMRKATLDANMQFSPYPERGKSSDIGYIEGKHNVTMNRSRRCMCQRTIFNDKNV